MKTSDQIGELATALAKAQGAISGAKKSATNPHFKSKYADLESVWDAIREPMSSNGLAIVQVTDADETGLNSVTRITHASGQWIEGVMPVRPIKPDMQSLGSALTYARRYAIMALVGVAPEDDDGNTASAGGDQPTAAFSRAPAPDVADVRKRAAANINGMQTVEALRAYTSEQMPVWKRLPGDACADLLALAKARADDLKAPPAAPEDITGDFVREFSGEGEE